MTSFKLIGRFLPILILFISCSKQNILPKKGVCAHRGASQTHPENTISAFKEAIDLGAHMIEFDVRMTVDSVLVVIHDADLKRTTNGSGLVAEKNIAYISSLDAGFWKSPQFANEKVPLFSEVIDMMPFNIWLNMHIKGRPAAGIKAANIIIEKNREHQSIFACKAKSAEEILRVNDDLIICNMERLTNTIDYVDSTIKNKAQFIQLKTRSDSVLTHSTQRLKKNNVKINYYETDSTEKFINLINSGVDFILTNNLKKLLHVSKIIGINPVEPKFD